MKKTILLVLCLLTIVLPVGADSVWTPMDDWFFKYWETNNCDSIGRRLFTVKGIDGGVAAMETPLSEKVIGDYPDGTILEIDFICQIGSLSWGSIRAVALVGENTLTEDWEGQSGYVPMNFLEPYYDSAAFIEEHQDELEPSDWDMMKSDGFKIYATPQSDLMLYETDEYFFNYMETFDLDQYSPFKSEWKYTALDGSVWVSLRLDKPVTDGWVKIK